MKHLLVILFISLSLGQLQRISFFDQQINVYLHEVVMGIFVLMGMGMIRRVRGIGQIGKSTITFLAVLLLSLLNGFWEFSFHENMVGLLYWARLVLYAAFLGFLWLWVTDGGRSVNKGNWTSLSRGINLYLVLTLLFSIGQYIFYPNLRNLYYLGWDPHLYRVFGTLFDVTTAGIVLTLLFFWRAGQIRSIRQNPREVLMMVIIFLLILMTYSRITYLGFIIGAIYFFGKRIGVKKMMAGLFLFIALLFFLPRPFGEGVKLERVFTAEARLADMREGLELWKKNPLLGIGYNRIRPARALRDGLFPSHAQSAFSSSYITLLASTGILGFVAFLYLLKNLFVRSTRLGKTAILVVGTASLFDNVFINNFVILVLGVVIIACAIPSRR